MGDEIRFDLEEDTQPMKTVATPVTPTQAQLDEHRIDHLPYRSWCDDCVEAFGREWSHTASGEATGKRTIPLISCDYLYVTARGVFSHKEFTPVEGEDFLKVLVVYDGATRCLFAHGVPRKGVD